MNGQWFTIDHPSELQSGDIFQTPSKVPKNSPILPGFAVGAVKHVGMICRIGDELYVAHSPFGGYPCLEKYSSVFKDRRLERIRRTGVSTEQILNRLEEVKHLKYDFFTWNCEDLCRFLCSCPTGSIDQRHGYAIILLVLIILIILLLVIKK